MHTCPEKFGIHEPKFNKYRSHSLFLDLKIPNQLSYNLLLDFKVHEWLSHCTLLTSKPISGGPTDCWMTSRSMFELYEFLVGGRWRHLNSSGHLAVA